MKRSRTVPFSHPAAQWLFGFAALALLTWLCFRLGLGLPMTASLYLILLVLLSLTGGSYISLVVLSISAVASLHYFFAPPIFGFQTEYPLDLAMASAFLVTSLVVTGLVKRARRLRDQLRLAIDTIPAVVWTKLPDGSADFLNQRFRDYTGLSLEEGRGWGWMNAFHPEDRAVDEWRAALAAGEPFEKEARMRRADGEYRWCVLCAVPLRNEHGTIVRWYGTTVDVEDRKRAMGVLREQARLLDLTHDTIFARDMKDVITYWNSGAEELYGWAREEALGKVSHQLTRTIFPAPLAEIDVELLRTGRWEGELIHTKRDGTRVVVASRWALQRDQTGKPVAVLETNNDITERKRAEEALRESEEQWKAVFEHNPTMYFMLDAAGTVLSVNHFGAQQLGYTVDELDGHSVLNVFPEGDREAVRENVALCFEQLGRTMRWEIRKVRKDGTVLWVRETAKAMLIKKRPVVLIACEDITERKRAEEAQRAQEREHEEMQRQLQQAAKMEAIGRLAGGIAHDFNNILGAILGYSELAQKDLAEGGSARRHLDQVVHAGARAKGLVERILAFSRSGLGERVPVHVQSVVEETLDLLAASLPPGVRLERRLGVGNSAVVGEATQLHQVVMNLCTNAVQAMANGGALGVVLDEVALSERRLLSHGTLSPRAYVRLTVSDTGSGVPPEVLERMFEPFFTTKGAGEGTGLGLALVHGIVADFSGAIDVATEAGVGTTFTIWLPAAGDTARPAPDAASELPRGNGETLMIVDDEHPLVALAEETLAELGYEPAGFSSSVAALRAFRAEPQRFDLVLTDEMMPELTGTELAREIRHLRRELPIVLMTGNADAQLVDRAHAAGVGEVLRKPLVRRDIAEALARALHAVP